MDILIGVGALAAFIAVVFLVIKFKAKNKQETPKK